VNLRLVNSLVGNLADQKELLRGLEPKVIEAIAIKNRLSANFKTLGSALVMLKNKEDFSEIKT
jgi:hypothetical protein